MALLFHTRFLRALGETGTLAGLSGPERGLVLAYLCHADQNGVAWPGNETLSKWIGTNTRNVQRYRAKLVRKGVLVTESASKGHYSTKWRLAISLTPAQQAGVDPGTASRSTAAQDAALPRHTKAHDPGALRHSNSKEKGIEQTNNTAAHGGGGGGSGGFSQELLYLASVNVHPTQAVTRGLQEHRWTIVELTAKWKAITNEIAQGRRQGAFVVAIERRETNAPNTK